MLALGSLCLLGFCFLGLVQFAWSLACWYDCTLSSFFGLPFGFLSFTCLVVALLFALVFGLSHFSFAWITVLNCFDCCSLLCCCLLDQLYSMVLVLDVFLLFGSGCLAYVFWLLRLNLCNSIFIFFIFFIFICCFAVQNLHFSWIQKKNFYCDLFIFIGEYWLTYFHCVSVVATAMSSHFVTVQVTWCTASPT